MSSGPVKALSEPDIAPPETGAARELNRIEILRGLRISTWEASFSTVHATLTTGAFLTGFALWLGANNLVMGLVTAIPTLAGLIQILASYQSERLRERKWFTAWYSLGGRTLWLPILLLPLFLPLPTALAAFLALYAVSFALLNVPVPAWMSWMSDLVPPDNRGRYFARRNMVAGIVGMAVGLPAAWFLDFAVKRHHREALGFGTLFGVAVLAGLVSFVCLLRQPEPPKRSVSTGERPTGRAGVLAYYRAPFADPNFRRLMVFNTVFSTGQFFAAPFFTVYALERLRLDYVWLQVFATISSVLTLVSLPLWGYLTDKMGNRALLVLGVCGVFTLPLGWMFTTPDRPGLSLLLLTAVNVGGGLFWSLVGLTQFNLLIGLSPSEKTSVYVATMAAATGLAGGLAPLLGGVVMRLLHDWQAHLFGVTFFNFQVTFLISALLRIGALPLLWKLAEPQSISTRAVLHQLRHANPRSFRHIRQLQGGSVEARVQATEAIAETRNVLAGSELETALQDPSVAVRRESAHALGELGDAAAAEGLIAALQDPAPEVVEEAAWALGQTGDRQAVPALRLLLRNRRETPSNRIRMAAAGALGRLGGSEAVGALLDVLATAPEADLAETAVRALGEIGDRRAVPALVAALEAEGVTDGLRLALVQSLGLLGDRAALGALRALLAASEKEPALVPPLADALAHLDDGEAVLPLTDRLERLESPVARRQTAHAIGRLLNQGELVYTLLSRDAFGRDTLVARLIGEMQRTLRSTSARRTLRLALNAYTDGDHLACVRALERIARALPAPSETETASPDSSALGRRLLERIAGRAGAALPVEVSLIAIAALHAGIETGVS